MMASVVDSISSLSSLGSSAVERLFPEMAAIHSDCSDSIYLLFRRKIAETTNISSAVRISNSGIIVILCPLGLFNFQREAINAQST